jgi:hypothetical protein
MAIRVVVSGNAKAAVVILSEIPLLEGMPYRREGILWGEAEYTPANGCGPTPVAPLPGAVPHGRAAGFLRAGASGR